MDLEIENIYGVFVIKGNLDNQNAESFKKYFEYLLDFLESISIDLEGLESIDIFGVYALESIYRFALMRGKRVLLKGINLKQSL